MIVLSCAVSFHVYGLLCRLTVRELLMSQCEHHAQELLAANRMSVQSTSQDIVDWLLANLANQ